jgi:6-phosphogluconolactonase (cycloisomerase 2 family)
LRRAGSALLACLLLAAARPVAAEPEAALVLLQDGQGLAGLSRISKDVTASPDGRHVYATSDAYLIALRRQRDGRLAFVDEYPLFEGPGTRVVVAPDGRHVLVAAVTASEAALVVYERDVESGALAWIETESADLGGSAAALAIARDGTRVYVATPKQDALVAYARDAESGLLTFAQRIHEGDPGVSGLIAPHDVVVSPDDRHVYATGFVEGQSAFVATVALLRRAEDGSLAFVEAGTAGLEDLGVGGPLALLVAPDGGELLALDGGQVGGADATVRRFARAAADGRLSFSEGEPLASALFAGTASWFALRPDGRRLFVGGFSLAPVGAPALAYDRDEAGALTPVARVEPGGGYNGRGATSPDGHFVYTSQASGVRVLAPEAGGGAAAAVAGLAARAFSRRERRGPRRARASARA